MELKYEILRGYDHFCALQNEWQTLLKKLPFYFPTVTCTWLKVWIQAHKEVIQTIYTIIIRDDSGRLISIVPLYAYNSKLIFSRMKAISLMGGRDQMMTDIIVLPEHQQAVINLLVNIILKEFDEWDIFSFRRLDYSRGYTISLGRVLHKKKILHSSESRIKIPFLKIEGDWESYYAGRKKRFKKEIRRKTKKLSERGAIRYEVTESPMPTEQLYRFFNLENKGWKGANGSSILCRPHLLKLYSNLASIECEFLTLCSFNMFLDDRVISSSICFKTLIGLYIFKITYDEQLAKTSPGLLLRLYELEYAFRQRLKIYDFSGAAQPWMRFFTERYHYSMDIILYKHHLISMIRYLGYTKMKRLLQRWPKLQKLFREHIDE